MARQMKDSGVEWIGEIPEDWEVVPHKYIMHKEKEICTKYNDEDIISLTMNGVIVRDLINPIGKMPASFDGYQKVYAGNLLMCLFDIDVTPRCIGYIRNNGLTSPAYSQFVVDNCNYAQYYDYLLRMIDDGKYFLHLSKNLRSSLTEENFGAIKTVKPPIDEQQNIAEFLDEESREIDSVITKTKETIEDYKKYKQVIITDAVTKGLNPDVEMKESKSSYLGMIPAHWIEKRLRFLGMCQNGISKSSEYFGEGYPFVSYGDVYKNYTLPERGSGLIKSSEEDRKIYSVQYGDVFFTRTSETIEEVGFASTCLKSIANATFAGFVIRFRPNNQEELLPEFSKYYFRSDVHRKFFVKEMNLVTRASLSQELLKKLPVLLPPLEEQRKIAEYLNEKCSEIDKLVAKKEELLVDLEDYKKSLIYEYVTGKKEVEKEIG